MRHPAEALRRTLWYVALGALLAPGLSQAGAGLRSEDSVFYNGTLGYHWATQYWDEQRDKRPIGCRSEYLSFSNYLEYGFSYYRTLYGQLGLARATCGNESEAGLGDLKLGVRGRINRYLNDRAWELEVTIPTRGGGIGRSSVSCGAFEFAANLEREHEDALPGVNFTYGSSLRLAQAPLVHSLRGKAGASGAFAPRWRWRFGMEHAVPLTERAATGPTALPDCGTDSHSVRLNAEIKFQQSRWITLGCGAGFTAWGEDTSVTRGVYCGFSRLWE